MEPVSTLMSSAISISRALRSKNESTVNFYPNPTEQNCIVDVTSSTHIHVAIIIALFLSRLYMTLAS